MEIKCNFSKYNLGLQCILHFLISSMTKAANKLNKMQECFRKAPQAFDKNRILCSIMIKTIKSKSK